MSSDLERFRDHCRKMSDSEDVSDDDRALWVRLANEIDAYLVDDDAQAMLELDA